MNAIATAAAAALLSGSPGPTLRALYGLPAPRTLTAARTALLLVDFQAEFTAGRLTVPGAAEAAARAGELLGWARANGIRVLHVRQAGKPGGPVFAPGTPGAAGLAEVAPGPEEPVLEKAAGGAFTRTGLELRLREAGVTHLVVAGIMTHLAVDLTARDGALLGFEVLVAADACATRDLPGAAGGPPVPAATVHAAALAALADRFATVLPARALAELPVEP